MRKQDEAYRKTALVETERANETLQSLKGQVKIAEIHAQAIVNSERPWIVVSVQREVGNKFLYIATNEGRTPAHIKAVFSGPLVFARHQIITLPDGFNNDEGMMAYPPCLIPPRGTCIVGQCILEELRGTNTVEEWFRRLSQSFTEVYYWGKIIYTDALNPTVRHKTKWFYRHLPIEGFPSIPAPRFPEYNTYEDEDDQKPN